MTLPVSMSEKGQIFLAYMMADILQITVSCWAFESLYLLHSPFKKLHPWLNRYTKGSIYLKGSVPY